MLMNVFLLGMTLLSSNGRESFHLKSSKGTKPAVFRAQPAYVFNEHFSALRREPDLQAPILERLRRGHFVAIIGRRRARQGTLFFRVAATRRKRGWVDAGALVSPTMSGDDGRLLEALNASEGFARIELCRVMDLHFRRSPLRAQVLMVIGREGEAAAQSLTDMAQGKKIGNRARAASRTLEEIYLNFEGLDRYNRLGIHFRYDPASIRYIYDGEAYREILRSYPGDPHIPEAAQRLKALEVGPLGAPLSDR